MERITYRISLDTQKNGVQKILQGFNVGDQVARRIEIALTAGGTSIDLPDTGVTALMYVTVDGIASVNAVTIEDGRAFYDVDANDTAKSGMVMMNLKVLDTTTGMVLYAPQFQLEVWENGIGSSSAATSPTFTALESALAQAQLYSQRTIKSVYIDDDTDIFTVEYMDGSVYTSSVIADAVAKIGQVEDFVVRAEEAAQNATTSETNAHNSEVNALASEVAAKLSEQNAAASLSSVQASAAAALASERAAQVAETNALASERAAYGYAGDSKTNADIAQSSEANALTSEVNAYGHEQNARTSAAAALASEQVATTAANNTVAYATAAESYAVGGTGSRAGEDNDNAKYYKEICQQIAGGIQGGLIPMGTVSFANLPTVNIGTGWLYNISDAFTSDSRFKDGAGIYYEAGSDVYRTADGFWDVLSYGVPKVNGKVGNDIILDAGDLLMSNYAKATTAAEIVPTDTILEAFGKMEKAHDDIDLAKANKTNMTAGTYKSVTVNQDGMVTAGTNPTTLAGFGITNGATKEDIEDVPHSEPVEDYAGIEPPTIDADILGGKYRASDVDEIKEDISNIKSDMSRMHNYSTAEHVVGKWTDGRDVYERTVVVNALHIVAESGFNAYRATVLNDLAEIVSVSGQIVYDGVRASLPYVSFARGGINEVTTNFVVANNQLMCTAIFYIAVQTTVRFEITVRYLK